MELTINNGNITMSSREIAEETGKRHDHVLRDIDTLNENYENLALPKVGVSSYKDSTGRSLKCYELTRMQTFDLMTGYSVELRIKVNRRWEELEKKQSQLDFSNPETVLMLAENWKKEHDLRIQKEQQLQLAEQTINKQAPKVEYHDKVLQSTSTYATTQVAADLGVSAIRLNRWLFDKGMQFKVNGTWVPSAKIKDKEFMKSKTFTYKDEMGNEKTSQLFYWTEAGRKFVMELWNGTNQSPDLQQLTPNLS